MAILNPKVETNPDVFYHPYPHVPIGGLFLIKDPAKMLLSYIPEKIKRELSVPMSDDFLEKALAERADRRRFWQDPKNFPYKRSKENIAASYLPELLRCERSIGFKLSRKYEEAPTAPSESIQRDWDTGATQGDYVHFIAQEAVSAAGLIAPNTDESESGQSVLTVDDASEDVSLSDNPNAAEILARQNATIKKYLVEAGLEQVSDRTTYDLAHGEITGRVDGIGVHPKTKELFHFEVKSVATKNLSFGDKYFPKQLKLPQARIYQHFTGLDRTRFVVIRREAAITGKVFDPNNWFELSYFADVDTGIPEQQTPALLARISRTVRLKEKAPATPGKSAINCGLCGFQKYCDAYQIAKAQQQ